MISASASGVLFEGLGTENRFGKQIDSHFEMDFRVIFDKTFCRSFLRGEGSGYDISPVTNSACAMSLSPAHQGDKDSGRGRRGMRRKAVCLGGPWWPFQGTIREQLGNN